MSFEKEDMIIDNRPWKIGEKVGIRNTSLSNGKVLRIEEIDGLKFLTIIFQNIKIRRNSNFVVKEY